MKTEGLPLLVAANVLFLAQSVSAQTSDVRRLQVGEEIARKLSALAAEVSLTDASAVFLQQGLGEFTVSILPTAVRLQPRTLTPEHPYSYAELLPFAGERSKEGGNTTLANFSRFSADFRLDKVCVTEVAVRKHFGTTYVPGPTQVATHPVPPNALAQTPGVQPVATGMYFGAYKLAGGRTGFVNFQFNGGACALGVLVSAPI